MGLYSNVIFPRFLNAFMSSGQFKKQRSKLLSSVSGDILEIGFGTGLNLEFYPDHVRKITAIDPNAGMNKVAQRNIKNSDIEVDSRVLSGENLPIEDRSFDSVVCTWTLCSIPDAAAALREVRRVLRPGGKFFFVEHGLAPDPNVAKWQHRLTPIQKVIGDGCHLNRPIDAMITGEGFGLSDLETFYMPKAPKFAGYMFRGIATIDDSTASS
jgi:ubiquinone/menaquinone biosynthesis C-methylase UbiE